MEKPNLYLDLDETLIYSMDMRYRKTFPSIVESFKHHNFENMYLILERPGLQNFLDWIFDHFNVSIWSAASPDYVDFIAKNIIIGSKKRKLKRILNSNNCDKSQQIYGEEHLKKLDLLWDYYKLSNHCSDNTILLDDLRLNVRSQPENCMKIKKFIVTKKYVEDQELLKIKNKLENVLYHFKKKKKIDKSPMPKSKKKL
jgi:hypothetical protein